MLKSKFSQDQSNLAVSFGQSGGFNAQFPNSGNRPMNANFQSSGLLKTEFNKTNGIDAVISILKEKYAKIYQDTIENWNAQPKLIAEKNAIYVYTNFIYGGNETEGENELLVPHIKIGNGESYLIDLSFVNEDAMRRLYLHINDMNIHVSEYDRIFWNNKVSSFIENDDPHTLILSKNLFKLEE